MTGVYAAVFKAIHEGKWLTIEYRNRNEQTTRYWIAIRELRLPRGVLVVDGLHLGQLTVQELSIYLDRIRSAELVEGSWCPVNEALVADIEETRISTPRYSPTRSTCGCWTTWPPATGWTACPTRQTMP